MNPRPKSVYANLALAFLLALGVIGVSAPAHAEASAESQELALQLVQRAEFKKLAMLSTRAHLWTRVNEGPVDPGLSTKKDQYFNLYECLRDKDASPFEAPLAKLFAENLTQEDMRGLLEFYASPAGNELIRMTLGRHLETSGIPKTGEYASFLLPSPASSAHLDSALWVANSELFIKMMKPLTQNNLDYSSAATELIRECERSFILPSVKTSTPPVYPTAARRAGVEGSMLVRVRIDASGQAKEARVTRRWFNSRDIPGPAGTKSTAEVFDEIGVSHAMNSTYVPATRGGVAVESWVNIPLRFVLEPNSK